MYKRNQKGKERETRRNAPHFYPPTSKKRRRKKEGEAEAAEDLLNRVPGWLNGDDRGAKVPMFEL